MTDLQKIYTKYIASRKFYRVVPKKQVSKILSSGINPDKKPFSRDKSMLLNFYKIPLKLHKKNIIMKQWWGFWADQKRIVETKKQDLSSKYIDFCNKYDIKLYTPLKGGALVWATYLMAKEILDKKMPVTPKESKLTRKVLNWSAKRTDEMVTLEISATSDCFNNARLRYGHNLYITSPFGTFSNFEKKVKMYGLKTYLPYLQDKKKFFMRCKNKINPQCLKRIK